MILQEAGFEVPGDEGSLETSVIFGPRHSANWLSHFDKTAQRILCLQFIFVSLILFIFLHLTSVVLVTMFYCSSSNIFGWEFRFDFDLEMIWNARRGLTMMYSFFHQHISFQGSSRQLSCCCLNSPGKFPKSFHFFCEILQCQIWFSNILWNFIHIV